MRIRHQLYKSFQSDLTKVWVDQVSLSMGQKGLWRSAIFKHKHKKLLKGTPTNNFQSVYSDFEQKKV